MLVKASLLIVSLLTLTGLAKSQEACQKTLAESPSISGLKLGMSFQDLQATIGSSIKIKPTKSGEGTIFENFFDHSAPSSLAGVRALYVRFFNNRTYQIEVFYEEKAGITKIEDLTAHMSQEFDLPPMAWTAKNGIATMKCGGFSLSADKVLNPHIELTDDAELAAFNEKRRREKTQKKKS